LTRRLALTPLLLLLALAPPARAVPITQYAFGRVTRDFSAATPGVIPPRTFAVGEGVSIRYVYDLDAPGGPSVRFDLFTAGGMEVHQQAPPAFASVQGAWPDLRIRSSADIWLLDLRYSGGVGVLDYEIDLPSSVAGFRASVQRTDTFLPADSPVPEPSTLSLGAIGAGVLGLAWARRRGGAR
jgi:hypothetical protein